MFIVLKGGGHSLTHKWNKDKRRKKRRGRQRLLGITGEELKGKRSKRIRSNAYLNSFKNTLIKIS